MHRSHGSSRLLGAFGALACCLLFSASAQAINLGTLDPQAQSQGHVIEDASGTAYIAWTRKTSSEAAEVPVFCKIPQGGTCTAPVVLPIPGAALETESASGAFPVFGSGSTVYVVAPRYVPNDVVIYTSENGGASFGPGQVIAGAYADKTGPTEVVRVGGEFLLGAYNAGIGFSAFSATEALSHFTLNEPGPGGVASSALGLETAGNPVIVYYNLSSPQYVIDYIHYNGSGAKGEEANWSSPATVTNGYVPRLAGGGASGLFLLSQDFISSSSQYATRVDVRKFSGSSFGPPLTLFNEPDPDLYQGGAIAESPAGHVAVVWPQFTGSEPTMRLFNSANGSSFGAPTTVASLGDGYQDQVNAQLASDDSGAGWLTFLDSAGLQLANLETGTKAVPLVPTQGATIGTDVVTFAGPKGCVRPGESITLKLTVKSAKRKHKVVLKIYKVIFGLDGKPFKTELRESVRRTGKVNTKPFEATLKDSYAAGSKHTASAQAFISERHGKHASRTLRITFTACS